MKAAILTVSDKGSRGEREDKSGEVIRKLLKRIGCTIVAYRIVPDEADVIELALREMIAIADVVVTTGGTGVSPRDVTPEATRRLIEKELPGFGEAMRVEGFRKTPHAIISRGLSGIAANGTLIINLPGSPRGVEESLSIVLPAIQHTVEIAKGKVVECANHTHKHDPNAALPSPPE